MIVRFRRGNMTETRLVHGKLDHHVSAARKRDGYKQLPVSVEFTKYGNTLFRPVYLVGFPLLYLAFFKTILAVLLRNCGLPPCFLSLKPSFLYDHLSTHHSDFFIFSSNFFN